MFLTIMVVGLVGLVVMALPAFSRHGGLGHGQLGHGHVAHGALHAGHVPRLAAHSPIAASHALAPQVHASESLAQPGLTRFLPSPRMVFSLLALYGAFANALLHAAHLGVLAAALVALLPAAAVERFLVTPVWRLLFRFEGAPSSPLEQLILCEASAVTPFRNGRGIVSLVRDGRTVQFSARLVDAQTERAVRVGDRLRVEDIDAAKERVTVSIALE
jgi:hypothetical protein